MSATRRRTQVLIGMVLVLVLIAAGVFWWMHDPRSGVASSQKDSGTATDSAKTDDPTVSDLSRKYLSGEASTAETVATAEGTVYARNEATFRGVRDAPGTLRILAVEAGVHSTHVRISLSTDSPAVPLLSPYIKVSSADIRGFELTADSANLRLTAGLWSQAEHDTLDCACAYLPMSTGSKPVEMSILYPALPDSVTQVQFSMPGFKALSAPVTRDE